MKKGLSAVAQCRGGRRAVGMKADARAGTAGERREAIVTQTEGVALAAMIRSIMMRKRRKK